ncbi:hypothetical protein F2Q69_00008977 [Brassica cretica]|uniref:NYN domain-containing protein n=2 Tax=Brassica TaxID=3705 RepID=A0A8S9P700_BRACR|nr:hypothetical protein F2Q69_00008977 [Brassica cretica]
MSEDKTYVFWNMDDYPIPDGVAPLDVVRNIKSALHRIGFPWCVQLCGDCQTYTQEPAAQGSRSRNNVAAFIDSHDNTALSYVDSLANSMQVIGGMERPSCHVHGSLVGADVFGWTIAYKPFTDDKEEDAYSCH